MCILSHTKFHFNTYSIDFKIDFVPSDNVYTLEFVRSNLKFLKKFLFKTLNERKEIIANKTIKGSFFSLYSIFLSINLIKFFKFNNDNI